MKCQSLFSRKLRKNISKCRLLNFLRTLSVKKEIMQDCLRTTLFIHTSHSKGYFTVNLVTLVHKIAQYLGSSYTSRKHAYIILTPLDPTFI